MKPKDLKSPFSFEEREPLIQNSVFYVPVYYLGYQKFSFPDFPDLFDNDNSVFVEYCSGNGDWIIDQAFRYPNQNWVAVEMRFDRVRKIWAKMKNHDLKNLFIVCAEAWTFSHFYLKNCSVDGVFINFPDPWPKKRHEKHRLIRTSFLDEIARVLANKQSVTFVTDDQDYLASTLNCFQSHSLFIPKFPYPFFTTVMPEYGRSSWFEQLWREKGKKIFYTQFEKIQ